MIWSYVSRGKINLTLRVVGIREDGYHRLVSVFKKLPPLERLSLELVVNGGEDRVDVIGAEVQGLNIVKKVFDMLRGGGVSIPPLFVSIFKVVPPGTGLGAGTGNGAAAFAWARDLFDFDTKTFDLASLGADLPFLASDEDISLVSGIGEFFSPVDDVDLKAVLIVPKWRCGTVESFDILDKFYSPGPWPISDLEAREEALYVLGQLRDHEKIGLLPNDFVRPLMERNSGYSDIFSACDSSGAIAWGVSGSGSSVFALYRPDKILSGSVGVFDKINCVEKIIFLE